MTSIEDLRAAQALSILETLERIPRGLCVAKGPDGKFLTWLPGRAPHAGESVTDVLAQLTCTMALEET